MRARALQVVGLVVGGILLSSILAQNAHAQSLALRQPITGAEALTGNWSLAQNDANNYTYFFSVNRSYDGGGSTLAPQIVYAVSIDANPTTSVDNAPSIETSIPGDPEFQETSWTPIDFDADRERMVAEVKAGLRDLLAAPEAQDFYADYRYSAIPHISLSAYMDAAVPEPSPLEIFVLTALALIAVKTNVLQRLYSRPLSPVSATARRR